MPNIYKLTGDGYFSLEVAGESNYQDAFLAICGDYEVEGKDIIVDACVFAEPSNPYDKNAVKILVENKTVGYLPRETAKDYHKIMKKFNLPISTQFILKANIRGGYKTKDGDFAYYGIWLDFPEPEEAVEQFITISKLSRKKKSCCLFPIP